MASLHALENVRIHCPVLFLQDACEQILERLSPVKASSPDAGWESWVKTAYGQRINLSAQGFYAGPNTAMNWDTGIAEERYHYFVYGAACSEVEVDCLTGEFSVLRTDIVSDVGDSINPAIDIGQVSFLPYILQYTVYTAFCNFASRTNNRLCLTRHQFEGL